MSIIPINQQTAIGIINKGSQGPAGPGSLVPSPVDANNGEMIAAQNGAWVVIPPPAGTGDMQSLIYDPRGIADDAFDISNLTGVIDGGVFT